MELVVNHHLLNSGFLNIGMKKNKDANTLQKTIYVLHMIIGHRNVKILISQNSQEGKNSEQSGAES